VPLPEALSSILPPCSDLPGIGEILRTAHQLLGAEAYSDQKIWLALMRSGAYRIITQPHSTNFLTGIYANLDDRSPGLSAHSKVQGESAMNMQFPQSLLTKQMNRLGFLGVLIRLIAMCL
jgi:hypothetical protein